MENISLESLDLKSHKRHPHDKPDYSATMKASDKRRYRNKLLFVWGIPVACGIFSFIYWFVFVPLLWSSLPHHQWPLLWFSLYGFVAFATWLAIMALCLMFWRHKKTTIVKCPKDTDEGSTKDRSSKESSNDSGFRDSPQFPTKVSTIQPATDTPPNSLYRDHTGSAVCIQVQTQNTPSLYNARTGRESYEAGYQLDSEPTSSNVSVQSVIPKPQDPPDKQNSGVIVFKKMDSIKMKGDKPKHISSSGSEGSSVDIKNIPRDRGDGSDNSDIENSNDNSPVTDDDMFQTTSFQAQASIEKTPDEIDADKHAPLDREESFKGLPEMNSFGEYLQLVTIETPMSPREAFFSDLVLNKNPDGGEVQMRSAGDRKSYCVGDLTAAQQRITEARKSMPLFLYASDLEDMESGPVARKASVASTTPPPPTVLEIVNESPKHSPTLKEHRPEHIYMELKHDEAAETALGAVSPIKVISVDSKHSSSGSKDSGKYFIANVLRTESVTSEVYLNIDGGETPSPKTYKMTKWETRTNGSLSEVPIPEESSEVPEGRWVLLSRDYAANNLEAFIRIESEAMARERTEGRLRDDDTDSDSVFLEYDQC